MTTTTNIKQSLINKLAREELIDMIPYQSARRLQKTDNTVTGQTNNFNRKIWLNANEAPGDGNYQLSAECINRYPDFQPENLLKAYSDYCKLPVEYILATRGADEGIELIIRTFCKAYQDSILICPPTYGMYAISAENHGAGIVKVPLVDKILDIEEIIAQKGTAKVIFLCSPGNPTGNLLPQTQIKAVLDEFVDDAIVVVDEAYIEFCSENTVTSWLARYPNLIVLRTLSKAFALAGLRCGFALASPEIITMLSKVIAPYPISAPVAQIASQALASNNLSQMTARVSETNALKQLFVEWLEQQAWCNEVYPSDANFVLFNTPYKALLFNGLKQQNILIRDQSKQLSLVNCLRVSIGSKQELDSAMKAINDIINDNQASESLNNNASANQGS
ncbi:histidinol-phosphate transaminase [Thalassotalea atypica]|uniref:histidinol-phosphate transaminase n=1 Tax=Thalassotalea atypica TaxID=2054316 RepID=UPI002572D1A2|nr:histidinol-phosphate transaminase [Thalassotalea atypica]